MIDSLLDTLVERLLGSEDRDIGLHDLLHSAADLVGALRSVGGSNVINGLDGIGTSVGRDLSVLLTRAEAVSDGVGNGTAKDDQVEKGVGSETVGTVNGDTSSLTASEKTWDDLVLAGLIDSKNLTSVLCRNTTHVVMYLHGR